MHGNLADAEKRATFVEEKSGKTGGHFFPKTWFAELVQDLWPIKGAAAVAQYAPAVPDRTTRNYQSGHSEPKGSVVCYLLRGNEGYRVLSWIMRDSDATWWLIIQHERRLAELARDIFGQLETVMK